MWRLKSPIVLSREASLSVLPPATLGSAGSAPTEPRGLIVRISRGCLARQKVP